MDETLVGSKPIVCMTGDVHHDLGDAAPIYSKNEHLYADEYQKVLEKHGGSGTYFVTGKCLDENLPFWEDFAARNVEIGGHTYWAFRPRLVLRLNSILFRSIYGGHKYQKIDIAKCFEAFSKLGLTMRVWRTHTYFKSHYVYSLLAERGVKIISDLRQRDLEIIEIKNQIHIPITCLNDDKIHMFHCYGDGVEMVYEWDRIEKDILGRIMKKDDIVILLHPVTMKILDNFHSFERILVALRENGYRFVTLTELVKEKTARVQS